MRRQTIAALVAGAMLLSAGCASDSVRADDAPTEQQEKEQQKKEQQKEDRLAEAQEDKEQAKADRQAQQAQEDAEQAVLLDEQSEMLEWIEVTLPYSEDLMALFTDIGDAASSYDTFALESHCSDLEDLAADARVDTLPAPNDEFTDTWSNALDAYEAAGEACVRGAADMDPYALEESVDYMNEATGYVEDMTALMEDYDVLESI